MARLSQPASVGVQTFARASPRVVGSDSVMASMERTDFLQHLNHRNSHFRPSLPFPWAQGRARMEERSMSALLPRPHSSARGYVPGTSPSLLASFVIPASWLWLARQRSSYLPASPAELPTRVADVIA